MPNKGRFPRKSSFDVSFCQNEIRRAHNEAADAIKECKDQYDEYRENGGHLDEESWQRDTDQGQKLTLKRKSCQEWKSMFKSHSKRLKVSQDQRPLEAAFWKCFVVNKFDLQSSKQAREDPRFRPKLLQSYKATTPDPKFAGKVWEPVLGAWIDGMIVGAAHLFPHEFNDTMSAIFGKEADIWDPKNGLLLYKPIEKLLERGSATLVPAIEGIQTGCHRHPILDATTLEEWKKKPVKEYRFWILRPDLPECQADLGCWDKNDTVTKPKNIAALHGKVLEFGEGKDFRPAARFVWWVHLNAIYRGRHWQNKKDSAWIQEIQKATKYWGTQGSYIRAGSLRTFIECLGQYLDDESKDVVMKNGFSSENETVEELVGLSQSLIASGAKGRGYEDSECD